ncbi:hypothetical protein ACA910_007819 [Epithemia clementina (nom. ined.)]
MSEDAATTNDGGVVSRSPVAMTASAVALSQLTGSKYRKQRMATGGFQEHLSAPTSQFARKQLEKMGWKEGTGLGKKRDGISTHIKVQKRQENAGLGIERHVAQTQQASSEWWKASLGDTLAKLGSKSEKEKKNKKKRSKNEKDEETKKRSRKDYTDDELFEVTGGARFGMRAGKSRNLAKWKRAESSSELSSSRTDMTAAESSSSSISAIQQLSTIQESSDECANDSSASITKVVTTADTTTVTLITESDLSKDSCVDDERPKKKRKKVKEEEEEYGRTNDAKCSTAKKSNKKKETRAKKDKKNRAKSSASK